MTVMREEFSVFSHLSDQDQKTTDQLATEKRAEANNMNASNGARRRYSNAPGLL
jgi:hypothetical protein